MVVVPFFAGVRVGSRREAFDPMILGPITTHDREQSDPRAGVGRPIWRARLARDHPPFRVVRKSRSNAQRRRGLAAKPCHSGIAADAARDSTEGTSDGAARSR